jgi:hypothetical protein
MDPQIIQIWLNSHVAYLDRHVDPARRALALSPYVTALAKGALDRHEVARALAYGWEETKFARHVVEGHCDRMPAGQRCDNGLARGPFSLHFTACRAAYFFRAGSEDSALVETVCALGLMRGYAAHCHGDPDEGAFAGMATGGGCRYSGARRRAQRTREIEAELIAIERELGDDALATDTESRASP